MRWKSDFGRAVRALATVAIVAGFGFAAQGCSTGATLTNTWSDPNYTGGKLTKVYVVSILKTEGARRTSEDIVAGEFNKRGATAVPSYQAFPDSVPSANVLQAYLHDNGYNGVIVNHLAGKDQRSYYVPPTSTMVAMPTYGGWYGWYGGVYSSYYSPGYTETEQVYTLDTSVWAVGNPGKLIWSGTTEITDPKSASEAAKNVGMLIMPKLEKAGII